MGRLSIGLSFNSRSSTSNDLAESHFTAQEISIPHQARPPLAQQPRALAGANTGKASSSLTVPAPGSSSRHQWAKPRGSPVPGARLPAPDTGTGRTSPGQSHRAPSPTRQTETQRLTSSGNRKACIQTDKHFSPCKPYQKLVEEPCRFTFCQ